MSVEELLALVPRDAEPICKQARMETQAIYDDVGMQLPARQDPRWLIQLTTITNYGMTLWPIITTSRSIDVLVQKNLVMLWITCVDDTIDSEGSSRYLDDSAAVLLEGGTRAQTPAGAMMGELLRRGSAGSTDVFPLKLAIHEILVAQLYQLVARSRPWLAEPNRYLRHNVSALGFEAYLAIDLAAAEGRLADGQVRAVSRAYHELWTAIRYGNDCGSFARDCEEGALNVINLWRQDEGQEDVGALRQRAIRLAQAHLQRAREESASSAVPGLRAAVEAGARFVSASLQAAPFFETATPPRDPFIR